MLAATSIKTLPDVNVVHSLLQMTIALAVVVACIWGLSKVLARLKSGPRAKGAGGATTRRTNANGLTVLSRQSLGKDLSIATIKWNDREVLVGIAGSTITFLNDARVEEPAPAGGGAAGVAIADEAAETSFAAARAKFLGEAATRPTSDAKRQLVGASSGSRSPTSLLETLRNATVRR